MVLVPVLAVEGDMTAAQEQDLTIGQLVQAAVMEVAHPIYQSQIILEITDNMEEEIQGAEEEDFREADLEEEMIMYLEEHNLIEITVEAVHPLGVETKEDMAHMVLEEATFHGHLRLALHMQVQADLQVAMALRGVVHLYLVVGRVRVTAECITHRIGAEVGPALQDPQFSVNHQI